MKGQEVMTETDQRLSELRQKGHRVVGCFPLYPPLELLHSFGLTPVTLWGLGSDDGDMSFSDAHLQSYTCSVARHLTQFVLGEASSYMSALCMYNACDTLRNLPEILEQGLKAQGVSLPIFKLHIPAIAAERSAGTAYLDNRIAVLIKELETYTGQAFSAAAFLASCELYDKAHSLARGLEAVVSSGALSYAVMSRVLMLGHHLPIEAHLELLMETLASIEEHSTPRGPELPVMISGILPPPDVLIEAMEASGLRVVADDTAALNRSFCYAPRSTTDPGAYYQDFYCNHIPCSTLLATSDKRIAHIRKRLCESGARGFIFCGEKLCEYEYFDMPYLEQVLKANGIGTLSLEMGEHDGQSLGTLKSRIETFAELLRGV